MYLTLIFLPLLGSLIVGFGGRWLGYYGSCIISIFCVFSSMILSGLVLFEVGFANNNIFVVVGPWINSGFIIQNWSFLFDTLTSIMLLIITSISTLVHFYSVNYMQEDPHVPRFMSYLEIFTFFMLILVTSDNLIQMFLGWEGVGLASYLLINFWFTRLAANKASLKAILLNRVGDFGVLLGIFCIFFIFKSLNYITIFALVPYFKEYYLHVFNLRIHCLTLVSIFFVLGAVGKSAQLGLHTWLPDAMEGPTPVSALIHAATMVTAGVFLIIRVSPIIEYSPITLICLVIIGSLTAFFAAFTGIFQHDLKKVIAYSTCSQLGYMIFCCGLSNYNVSIFHLTNHAFFKALLFLGAGAVIHSIQDEQDMRRMGSLVNFLPVTYSLMLIGSLSLLGMPFLTGFYSKDCILELSNLFRNNNLSTDFSCITFWLGNLTALFTSYYSFRLLFLTFLNNANYSRSMNVLESSYMLLVPMLVLSLGSCFVGYLFKDFFIGLGTNIWNYSLFIYPSHFYLIESEFLEIHFKWLPFFISLVGALCAIFFNLNSIYITYLPMFIYNIFIFINKKWFFDCIYNRIIVFPLLYFGYYVSFKNLDRGFIELAGPYGISALLLKVSYKFLNFQTGQLSYYIFIILFSFGIYIYIYYILDFYILIFYLLLIFFI